MKKWKALIESCCKLLNHKEQVSVFQYKEASANNPQEDGYLSDLLPSLSPTPHLGVTHKKPRAHGHHPIPSLACFLKKAYILVCQFLIAPTSPSPPRKTHPGVHQLAFS